MQEGETGEKHDKNKVPEEALRLEALPNMSLKAVTIRRERFTEMFLSKKQICVSCKTQRWAGSHAVHSHNVKKKEKSGSIRDSVLTLFSLRQSLEVTSGFPLLSLYAIAIAYSLYSSSTAGRTFASYVANLGLILRILYGSSSIAKSDS